MSGWDAELASVGNDGISTGQDGVAHEQDDAAETAGKTRRLAALSRGREVIKKRPAAKQKPAHAVPSTLPDDLSSGKHLEERGYFSLGAYIKRLVHGASASDCSSSHRNSSETTMLGLLWDWFMARKKHVASITAAASFVNCSREELKRYGRRLASVILHHDHSARAQCEWQASTATSRRRLVYCDNCSEDETPMPLSVLQRLDVPSEFLKRVSDGATLQVQPIQARMQHLAITKAKSKE